MDKSDYTVKEFKKTLTTQYFYDNFYNFDLVQGYCKGCPRYNTNYSCSPVDIDIKRFVFEYDFIDIYVTQLFFEPEQYEKDYSPEELKDFLYKTFFKEKRKIVNKVLESEEEYVKAQSLTGPCNHCAENCKELYNECLHPEIRRYSLASIGMDSKKILKELFNIDLLLINGVLPKYLNNVTSILYKK
jgi:predicted metal-binding protein